MKNIYNNSGSDNAESVVGT